MIKGITEFGIGDFGDLKTQVLLASKNGFKVVDTNGASLRELIDEMGLENAKNYLKENDVKIGALQFPVNWRESDEQFNADLPRLMEEGKLAESFGIEVFYTFFLPSTDRNVIDHLIALTNRIKLSAQILQGFGCKLALEHVGPNHLRKQWKNEFIYDLPTTIDWIEMIGERNVGVLLDSLHWYVTGANLEEITALSSSQIAYVHINDAPDLPKEEVLDNGRVYPGEGVIDLVGFLKAVEETGYQGPVSQEILTETPPKESSEALAKRSGIAVKNVFEKAGLS